MPRTDYAEIRVLGDLSTLSQFRYADPPNENPAHGLSRRCRQGRRDTSRPHGRYQRRPAVNVGFCIITALAKAVSSVSIVSSAEASRDAGRGSSDCRLRRSRQRHLDGIFRVDAQKIDFYDITYSTTDVKILCSATPSGVHITITAPDGTKAQATQRDDGSQKSDITISGGRHDQQILTNGAIWKSVNGDIGCELEPDGSYDNVFYMHDGAAVCPGRHSS